MCMNLFSAPRSEYHMARQGESVLRSGIAFSQLSISSGSLPDG